VRDWKCYASILKYTLPSCSHLFDLTVLRKLNVLKMAPLERIGQIANHLNLTEKTVKQAPAKLTPAPEASPASVETFEGISRIRGRADDSAGP
jgi:hypothetical protein